MSAETNSQFFSSLRLFVEIARLRRGPEDLPASASLLVATVVANLLLTVVLTYLLPHGPMPIAGPYLAEAVLALLWFAALLRLAGRPERFLQTATAVFGFQLVLVAPFVLLQALAAGFAGAPSWQPAVVLLMFALLGWALAVTTRILNAATGWPVILCMAMVLLQELATLGLVVALFPDVVADPGAAPASPAA